MALSLAALAIAASFMLAKTVVSNEGGVPMDIVGYATGYWLWLASMVVALMAALAKKAGAVQADERPA